MINIHKIDKEAMFTPDGERELLEKDPEHVRSFYSLTGPARREYAVQMAEAEAERIRIVRQAQADGILAIRRAEAEGLKLIGMALSECPQPELVARLAELVAAEDVAQSLGDGRATKLIVPQNAADLFGVMAACQETLKGEGAGSPVA